MEEQPKVYLTNELVWIMWIPCAFLLPAAIAVVRLIGGAGWELVMMIMFSPIWIPLLGIAEWLPRIILRARSFRRSPTVLTGLFFSHWMCVLVVFWSFQPIVEMGEQPSLMRQLLPFLTVTEAIALGTVALFAAIATWVTMIVYVSLAKPHAHKRYGALTAALAAVFTPIVLVGVAKLVAIITA